LIHFFKRLGMSSENGSHPFIKTYRARLKINSKNVIKKVISEDQETIVIQDNESQAFEQQADTEILINTSDLKNKTINCECNIISNEIATFTSSRNDANETRFSTDYCFSRPSSNIMKTSYYHSKDGFDHNDLELFLKDVLSPNLEETESSISCNKTVDSYENDLHRASVIREQNDILKKIQEANTKRKKEEEASLKLIAELSLAPKLENETKLTLVHSNKHNELSFLDANRNSEKKDARMNKLEFNVPRCKNDFAYNGSKSVSIKYDRGNLCKQGKSAQIVNMKEKISPTNNNKSRGKPPLSLGEIQLSEQRRRIYNQEEEYRSKLERETLENEWILATGRNSSRTTNKHVDSEWQIASERSSTKKENTKNKKSKYIKS